MNANTETNTQRIAAIKHLYEQGDFETARHSCEQLLSAARLSQSERVDTLYWYGITLVELGNFTSAKGILAEGYTLTDPASSEAARYLSVLGVAQMLVGEVMSAQQNIEQALALQEQLLGSDHPETIESLNHLGIIFKHQGEQAKSLALHEKALARCERSVGDSHRVTAEVCTSLSLRLGSHSPRARALGERALAISERLLGPTHPTTAQLMNNLATSLVQVGDETTAQALLERSLALHEERLGPNNPRLAYVLHNLADIYERNGLWDKAQHHHERALILRTRGLGAQHPDTLTSIQLLSNFYADVPHADALNITRFSFPLSIILFALQAAAGTLSAENSHMPGAHLDAETATARLHELVERIEAAHLSPPLTDTQSADLERAADLQAQSEQHYAAGEYQTAHTLLEQAIALIEAVRGTTHLDLIAPLNQMIPIMKALQKPTAVLPLTQRIADIHTAVLGDYHPNTQLAMLELASMIEREYGMEAAFPLFVQNHNRIKQIYGPDGPQARMLPSLDDWRALYEGKMSDLSELSASERYEAAINNQPDWVEDVLQGIDEIDWHSLQHAYGPADNVPGLLRLLVSDDEQVRDRTWEALYSSIWHQGTVYQASAYAVPFLLRLLEDPRVPDRLGVLGLLQSLATGSSYLDVHYDDEESIAEWSEILAKQGKNFDEELQHELRYVRAANQAVGEGAERILAFAEDAEGEHEMRESAIATLGYLTTRADLIVPRLKVLLVQAHALPFRITIIKALAMLLDDSPTSQHFFTVLMQQEDNPDAVFAAAIALVTRAREHASDAAVTAIIDAFRRYSNDPDNSYHIYHEAVEPLLMLGRERSRASFLKILPMLPNTNDNRLHTFARSLLNLEFDGGANPSQISSSSWNQNTKRRTIEFFTNNSTLPPAVKAATLTNAQREVLAALVAHDPFWKSKSNLFSLFGLPDKRKALRALLSEAN